MKIKTPKIYLEWAGFRRIGLMTRQITSWDSRRDAVYSKVRRIMQGERDHVKYRAYNLKSRIA